MATKPDTVVDNYARMHDGYRRARRLVEELVLHDDANPEQIAEAIRMWRESGRDVRKVRVSVQEYLNAYGKKYGMSLVSRTQRRLDALEKV